MKKSICRFLMWALLLSVITNCSPQYHGEQEEYDIDHTSGGFSQQMTQHGYSNAGKKMAQDSHEPHESEYLPLDSHVIEYDIPKVASTISRQKSTVPKHVAASYALPSSRPPKNKTIVIDETWPWAASLGYKDSRGKIRFYCAGALIHPKHVITSATCAHKYQTEEDRFVRLGAKTKDKFPVDMIVEDIIVHSDYHYPSIYNDLALLRFRNDVESKLPNVQPISLINMYFDVEGILAILTGYVGENRQNHLNAKMKVMKLEQCNDLRKLFKHLEDNFPQGILNNQLCTIIAQGASKTNCKNADGAVLIYRFPADEVFALVGIAAGKIGCGSKGSPGFYTRIPKYLKWIDEKMKA